MSATIKSVENQIRSAPLQSVGVAVAGAYLVSRLPILSIVGITSRVALALVRPALLVLGGVKGWDLIRSQRKSLLEQGE